MKTTTKSISPLCISLQSIGFIFVFFSVLIYNAVFLSPLGFALSVTFLFIMIVSGLLLIYISSASKFTLVISKLNGIIGNKWSNNYLNLYIIFLQIAIIAPLIFLIFTKK